MNRLFALAIPIVLAGCSLHDQIEDTAQSWQGQRLSQVEGAWGAPSQATDPLNWTMWTMGNDQGGWVVGFHTHTADQIIDDHVVTTWGTLPNDLPSELAPKHRSF
jgi:hypothetical protein|tara:strand:- start:857 stop:1171 length:315 start_codon:yes stop_codon:yes gene_type:complete